MELQEDAQSWYSICPRNGRGRPQISPSPLRNGNAVPGWDLLRTLPGKTPGLRDLSYSYTSKLPSLFYFDTTDYDFTPPKKVSFHIHFGK